MKVPGWVAAPASSSSDPAPATPKAAAGVEGNTRLTAATGMVLLVLLAVEGVTILSVRQMITLHVFVGVMLLGPVLLKSGSTVYRFVRYYTGSPAYQTKGAPHPLLRVLGPMVILSTLALLGTGIALIFEGTNGSDGLLTAHQTCFWIWVTIMTVHVLAHLWQAGATSWTELRSTLRGPAARARRWRYAVIGAALVIGVGIATALLPTAAPWTTRQEGPRTRPSGTRIISAPAVPTASPNPSGPAPTS